MKTEMFDKMTPRLEKVVESHIITVTETFHHVFFVQATDISIRIHDAKTVIVASYCFEGDSASECYTFDDVLFPFTPTQASAICGRTITDVTWGVQDDLGVLAGFPHLM